MNFNNIRELLRQDRIEETLEELDSYTQQYNKSYRDEVLLLSARFNALNRDIHLRIISDEDRQRHANVIRYDAAELINALEKWAQGRPELAPEESQLGDELERNQLKQYHHDTLSENYR